MDQNKSEKQNPEAAARNFSFAPIRYLWFSPVILLLTVVLSEGKAALLVPFLGLIFLAAILYVLCDIRFMVWNMKK